MDAQTSPLVLSQLPKYIQKSTTAQLKHGPFLLQHCQCHLTQYLQENNTHKLIEQRIISNRSERFYLLNISTRFNRRLGVRLWRFRCRLAVYKKRTKYWQLCPNCYSCITLENKLFVHTTMITLSFCLESMERGETMECFLSLQDE